MSVFGHMATCATMHLPMLLSLDQSVHHLRTVLELGDLTIHTIENNAAALQRLCRLACI